MPSTLLCSATSHDSNAEKSSEVAIPPSTRPIMRILYSGECLGKREMRKMETNVVIWDKYMAIGDEIVQATLLGAYRMIPREVEWIMTRSQL
uniref:Uncharacterized protein n=1 Tax=Oryza barthii TaxID=65489 RepID=A0A0D3FCY7_9ORYZ